MKKLLPGMLALLILICSCSTKKSFLHQRYTNFKHTKTETVAKNRSQTETKQKKQVPTPQAAVVVNSEPAQTQTAEPSKTGYTQAVVNKVIVPVVLKGKEKVAGLTSSNSKQPGTKLTKVKPLNLTQKHEKHGLLWGVIDAILAIILLIAFVALVCWLIIILV